MLNIVKVFENGTVLFFDEGQFDEYCVYQLNEGEKQFAPRDKNILIKDSHWLSFKLYVIQHTIYCIMMIVYVLSL